MRRMHRYSRNKERAHTQEPHTVLCRTPEKSENTLRCNEIILQRRKSKMFHGIVEGIVKRTRTGLCEKTRGTPKWWEHSFDCRRNATPLLTTKFRVLLECYPGLLGLGKRIRALGKRPSKNPLPEPAPEPAPEPLHRIKKKKGKKKKNYAAKDQKKIKKDQEENKRLKNKFLESPLRAPAASLMRKA